MRLHCTLDGLTYISSPRLPNPGAAPGTGLSSVTISLRGSIPSGLTHCGCLRVTSSTSSGSMGKYSGFSPFACRTSGRTSNMPPAPFQPILWHIWQHGENQQNGRKPKFNTRLEHIKDVVWGQKEAGKRHLDQILYTLIHKIPKYYCSFIWGVSQKEKQTKTKITTQ